MSLDEKLEQLAKWLAGMHARDSFNGSVLIAKDGAVLFEKHHGFADVAGTVPLSGQSSFALASVSKQFTAMGIMLLAQAGKLSLGDTLARHIPELADFSGVTIRHLLHHTAGVPDYLDMAEKFWGTERTLTNSDVIGLLTRHRPPPYFAPGSRFEYSNTGYVLAGEIISRVSGVPFPEFMADAIFHPLGMNDSAAFNFASQECPLRARAFGVRRELQARLAADLNYLDGVFGDAGIYASAEDLVRWDAALRDGALIPTTVYAEAYNSGELNNGTKTGYGFGWEIDPPDVVWHWGELQGFTAYLRRDLGRNTLLVLLSNMGPSAWLEPLSAELTEFAYDV
jgi:CubicO group peptidase (beta-lactamase class C family)